MIYRTPAVADRDGERSGEPAAPDDRAADAPSTTRRSLLTWAVFVVPAYAALMTCLHRIADRQIWRDEEASWWAAKLSFSDLSRLIHNCDFVLLPYYLFLHVWIGLFGDSPTVLRIPSAIAMAVAAGLLGLLGKRLFRPYVGLIAGLLFALVPEITRYGEEARPYAFAILATIASTLLLVRATDGKSRRSWGFYALSILAVAWTNLVAIIVLAAHVIMVVEVRRRAGRVPIRDFAIAAGAGLLLSFPVILVGYLQSAQVSWIPVPYRGYATFDFYPASIFGDRLLGQRIMVIGLFALIVERRHAASLLTWGVLPPLLTYYTAGDFHLFFYRYMLFTLPAWALLAAAAIGRLGPLTGPLRTIAMRWALGVIVVAGLVVNALPGIVAAHYDLVSEPDYRGVAQLITARQTPGDAMIFDANGGERLPMAYLLRHDAGRPTDALLYRSAQRIGRYAGSDCPDPDRCLAAAQRLWLVTTATWTDPYAKLTPQTAGVLRSRFHVERSTRLYRATVVLLTRT